MKSHEPVIRSATEADLINYYGENPGFTVRALVADLDGEIIAIGGLAYYPGQMLAFSEMKEPMRKYPKLIYKSAFKVAELIKKYGGSVVAVANCKENNAGKLLKKLGFISVGMLWHEHVISSQ